jgi:hypothetical protein
MTVRRIKFLAVAMVLFTLFLTSGSARPTSMEVGVASAATIEASSASNWIFEGCWTQFSAGQCRDVYRDQQGSFWICRACGTTGNPSPGKCNPISQATLASGFWCS